MPRDSHLLPAHTLILAAHLASTSDISSLQILASNYQNHITTTTLLRVLLTFLPETFESKNFFPFLKTVSTVSTLKLDTEINWYDIDNLRDKVAQKRARDIEKDLIPLDLEGFAQDDGFDSELERFLVHRAHRVDEETGLLHLVSELLSPFLQDYKSIREWFTSTVLPLLRLEYDFYPQSQRTISLNHLERANPTEGVRLLLGDALNSSSHPNDGGSQILARDLKSLLGPWAYTENSSKRRKLHHSTGTTVWDETYKFLIDNIDTNFFQIAEALKEWDGPKDIDLNGYDAVMLSEKDLEILIAKYSQALLAVVYATDQSDQQSLDLCYSLLSKVSHINNQGYFDKIQIESNHLNLPAISTPQSYNISKSFLDLGSLLQPDNLLTTFTSENLLIARYIILSSWLLSDLGNKTVVKDIIKIKSWFDQQEQLTILQKTLHNLISSSKKSRSDWLEIRTKLQWLWSWGNSSKSENKSNGIFGQIDFTLYEKEILETLILNAAFADVINLYIKNTSEHSLTSTEIEQVIISTALQHFDNATNGNRTRGSMKQAWDTVIELKPYFPNSIHFARLQSLIAATHSMSFYSLTINSGVPFSPVSIRVAEDPLSLIERILSQNHEAYRELNDLVDIGRDLTLAGLNLGNDESQSQADLDLEVSKSKRRVIAMVVEAALAQDDFETAYSYVVTWLPSAPASSSADTKDPKALFSPRTTSTITSPSDQQDNLAYRAALAAGKHKSATASANSLRRIEQRMDLLSNALLLAPGNAIVEILAAWRRCEEERTALLDAGNIDDAANEPGEDMPGGFGESQSKSVVGSGRRGNGGEEAPMGLFDVARGAAKAFRRSVVTAEDSKYEEVDQYGERVRKRDMVANAVTGGLASGIGWVLGATPVNRD